MEKQLINQAQNTIELDEIVEQAATDRNCELDNSLPYKEQAAFLREEATKGGNGVDKMIELAELLEAAEIRWAVIESQAVESPGEGYQVKRENFRYEKLNSKVNGQNAWHIYQYEPGIPGAPGAYVHIGIGTGETKAQALQDVLTD